MGCWNVTCGISNISITECTDVYAFIIAEKKCEYSCVYPGDIGSPISLPIEGKYNNYGSVCEIKENSTTKYICNYFKKLTNENEIKWSNEIPDFNSIESVMSEIERGTQNKSFFIFFVIKDIFDKLIGDYDFEKGKKFFMKYHELYNIKKEYNANSLLKYHEIKNQIHDMTFNNDDCFVSLYNIFDDTVLGIEKNKYILSNTDDDTINFVIKNSIFIHKMMFLRKSWSNSSGTGNQSENFEDIKTLSKIMIDYCEKQIEIREGGEE